MTLDEQTTTVATEAPAGRGRRASRPRLGIIDSDMHPTVRTIGEIKPYLTERWWRYLQSYGPRPKHGFAQGDPYPKAAPRAARRDAWGPKGAQPGSDLDFTRSHYLDAYNIEFSIMAPLQPTGQADRNLDFAAAISSAVNDWQRAKWTGPEPRFKASIVIPYEDPPAAVREIERCADDPSFAQILMLARTFEPLGSRKYWPIYEKAAEVDLPLGVHVFGYSGYPVTGAGWPSYYIEEMTGHAGACQAGVTSLAMQGVFERIPTLRMIIIEGGFAWLASLGWRLDKHWARHRDEVPHVTRPPSETLKKNLWISTQPMEEPERARQLLDVIAWIGVDRLLMATDYPHWDFDDPSFALPRALAPEQRQAIASGNARHVYRL
ncbi:MAG: amidohydrolase [Rhizobiales bacterium]|nr:amidohydrolase [Hyphomicrobiales bacterium]